MDVNLIIDGYNALFRLAKLEVFPVGSRFYIERENFIRVLSRQEKLKEYQVIIVFDGQEQKIQADWQGSILVIYTTPKKTADDFIIELIQRRKMVIDNGNKSIVLSLNQAAVVVTNDKKLKRQLIQINPSIRAKALNWLHLQFQ